MKPALLLKAINKSVELEIFEAMAIQSSNTFCAYIKVDVLFIFTAVILKCMCGSSASGGSVFPG
jgi:hypothetical protein